MSIKAFSSWISWSQTILRCGTTCPVSWSCAPSHISFTSIRLFAVWSPCQRASTRARRSGQSLSCWTRVAWSMQRTARPQSASTGACSVTRFMRSGERVHHHRRSPAAFGRHNRMSATWELMLTVYGPSFCVEKLNARWVTISFISALIAAFSVQASSAAPACSAAHSTQC